MKHEHDEALVEQRHRDAAANYVRDNLQPKLEQRVRAGKAYVGLSEAFARFEQSIRTTDAARIAELERQLVEYQRPTAEQVETFQQACERGFQMPSDPPPWPEMLKLAETFLARATLRSSPDAG